MVVWKRASTAVQSALMLSLSRELLLKTIPNSTMSASASSSCSSSSPLGDPNSKDFFDLPEAATTGFEMPYKTKLGLFEKYAPQLTGQWDQASFDQFCSEDAFSVSASTDEAMKIFLKTPAKVQRQYIDRFMDMHSQDSVNISWLRQCPPSTISLSSSSAILHEDSSSSDSTSHYSTLSSFTLASRKKAPSITIDVSQYPGCDNRKLELYMHRPPSASSASASSTPSGAALSAALIYTHGGAGIAGRAYQYDGNCARYAQQVTDYLRSEKRKEKRGMVDKGQKDTASFSSSPPSSSPVDTLIVFNVDYRLAPENKAPAGIMDAVGTILYLYEHGQKQFGIDPSRIGIAGDSGGGWIASAAAYQLTRMGLQGRLKFCMLLCPQVSDIFIRLPPSKLQRAEGGELTAHWWHWIDKQLKPGSTSTSSISSDQRKGGSSSVTKAALIGRKSSTAEAATTRNNQTGSSSAGGGGGEIDPCLLYPARMPEVVAKQYPRTAIITSEFDVLRRMGEDLAAVLALQHRKSLRGGGGEDKLTSSSKPPKAAKTTKPDSIATSTGGGSGDVDNNGSEGGSFSPPLPAAAAASSSVPPLVEFVVHPSTNHGWHYFMGSSPLVDLFWEDACLILDEYLCS